MAGLSPEARAAIAAFPEDRVTRLPITARAEDATEARPHALRDMATSKVRAVARQQRFARAARLAEAGAALEAAAGPGAEIAPGTASKGFGVEGFQGGASGPVTPAMAKRNGAPMEQLRPPPSSTDCPPANTRSESPGRTLGPMAPEAEGRDASADLRAAGAGAPLRAPQPAPVPALAPARVVVAEDAAGDAGGDAGPERGAARRAFGRALAALRRGQAGRRHLRLLFGEAL